MSDNSNWRSNRREFLTATGGLVAATLASAEPLSALAAPSGAGSASAAQPNPGQSTGANSTRKLLIGVFDPVYNHLNLEQMLEKMSALQLEAAEIGTGGYPGASHCPVQELLADAAKARAWKKKFEDRHSGGRAQLPRQSRPSRRQDCGPRRADFPQHGAAGRAPGGAGDRRFFRLSRRQSHRHHAQLGDVSLASGVRADSRLAVEGEGYPLLEGSGEVRPRAWNSQTGLRNAPRLLRLQSQDSHAVAGGRGRGNWRQLRPEPPILAGMRSGRGDPLSGQAGSHLSRPYERHGAV